MPALILVEDFDLGHECVGFYTIRHEHLDESETDRFIARFLEIDSPAYEPGYEEACRLILTWIEEIGNRGFARIKPRKENDAEALPPKPGTIQELDLEMPPLRLYYVRLSNQIAVLCGGSIKSGATNQESKGIMSHFRLANKVASALVEMISKDEIRLEDKLLLADSEEIIIWLPS